MTDIAKTYEPKAVEDRWYSFWDEKGYFVGETGADGEPFSIVIPPPNVTGALHVGHALNNSIQWSRDQAKEEENTYQRWINLGWGFLAILAATAVLVMGHAFLV